MFMMMRLQVLCCLILATSASFIAAEEFETHGNVVELNENTYDRFLAENNRALVEFYAPWCPHCKHLERDYDSLAEEYSVGNRIQFARIDAEKNGYISNRNNVNAYPTLILHMNGETIEYTGDNTPESIREFIDEKLNPEFALF